MIIIIIVIIIIIIGILFTGSHGSVHGLPKV
jgi:hypothetical protein